MRISVVAHMRRHGIGTLVMEELCERARAAAYKGIVLETTATWRQVIEFYKQFGFRITHSDGENIHFELEL